MDAAFLDIGLGRNALLYAGDVTPERPEYDKHAAQPIEKLLRVGDCLSVQIARPPVGAKGARVTSRLSLPGRYGVNEQLG
jgi:Rne/Rng family ribonuclease